MSGSICRTGLAGGAYRHWNTTAPPADAGFISVTTAFLLNLTQCSRAVFIAAGTLLWPSGILPPFWSPIDGRSGADPAMLPEPAHPASRDVSAARAATPKIFMKPPSMARRSTTLGIERDRVHRPDLALGYHVGNGCRIFLVVIGGPMRLEGGCVVINLVEEDVERVARQYLDVELAAARLRDGGRAVLLDGGHELLHLGRHDVEIDGVDEGR